MWLLMVSMLMSPVQTPVCASQVRAQLAEWEPHSDWRTDHTATQQVWRAPTDELGIWLEVRSGREGVVARRIAADGVTEVVFDSSTCKSITSIEPDATGHSSAKLDDGDLESAVSRYRHGYIYVWSPFDRGSMEGLIEVRKALETREVPVIAVMDPGASPDVGHAYARQYGLETAMRAADFRQARAVELRMRGATERYPSLVEFHDGQLAAHAIRGRTSIKKRALAGR